MVIHEVNLYVQLLIELENIVVQTDTYAVYYLLVLKKVVLFNEIG